MQSYREERRTSARVDMEGEAVIIAVHSDLDIITKPAKALCIDLSRRGALLKCTQKMPLGTLMTITFNAGKENENTVKGQVCRCTRLDETSFHVALQLI